MILKINNVEYPLQWGMGCLEMFCDSLDCEIDGLEKVILPGKDQIRYFTTLLWCALKNGAKKESIYDDFEVSYRDLQEYLDDLDQSETKAIVDDFKKSRYFGKTMAEHLFMEVEETVNTGGVVKKKSRSAKS